MDPPCFLSKYGTRVFWSFCEICFFTCSAGAENSDKLEKSRSKENQTTGDAESSSNDSMSSHKNEPSSVQKETKNDDSAPSETHGSDSEESGESTDVQTPDGKESSTYDDSDMAGFTDDEPLVINPSFLIFPKYPYTHF